MGRKAYAGIRQYSKLTGLGTKEHFRDNLLILQKSESLFDLKAYSRFGLAQSLAITLKLLEGTPIIDFITTADPSNLTMKLTRDETIALGNKIDSEIADKAWFMRSTFGYQRRAGEA
eukprot:12021406-Prorocentrum_lima.AAC.1